MKIVETKKYAEKKKMEGKDPCWDGYEMIGTKDKNGKEVPNCVPKSKKKAQVNDSSESLAKEAKKKDWSPKKEHKSDAGGLTEKGRKSYNKETGGNLKAPVTEDKPTGERKKRQDSYCSRSKGQMKMHNIDCSKDPDKRICKARRRWNCN